MAANIKLPAYESMDSEKGQLLAAHRQETACDDVAAPMPIVYVEAQSRGRKCLRFLTACLLMVFTFHAVRLFTHSCHSRASIDTIIYESSLFPHDTAEYSVLSNNSFKVDPSEVDSIHVDVKGDVLSRIHAKTSQSDEILFVFKIMSKKPNEKPDVNVTHEVEEGVLKVDVDSPKCKPKGHKGKKPRDGNKLGDGEDGLVDGSDLEDMATKRHHRHDDDCEGIKDVIVQLTMYLPQSKIKQGTNLKVNAAKSVFMADDLTNFELGTVDVNFSAGDISSKGIKAKAFFLYVANGDINGVYNGYTSFSAEIENGGITLVSLRSNQNAPSNVRLMAKTGGILLKKIEFSQNYVNALDASVANGGVKIFARDSFSGDFSVTTEIGSYKVSADTSGLEIENNVKSPTGGYVAGTFRSKDTLQDGRINVAVGHGSAELMFTSNGF
ncbi:hypothetical protein SeMB42_g03275 [Synchytrium endobioticum]|uniref:DUF4097 domain-containing protein n=1 Tax=Synchytrium endobioticum TaxID=286115 RepID=A0A507CHM4_9FUNG|nr:hypothetical protein SeLEV6574_g07492 [Synchytrium endobioticum]TPX47558.1 hypothetical protein SeMB42_g03275 [Synchytrium endobioticum]